MVKQFQHPLARRLIFEILPAADPTAEVAVTWGGFIHAAECGDDPAVRQIAGDMAVTFERQRQRQWSTPASAVIGGEGADDQVPILLFRGRSGIGERNERMIRHLETGGSMSTA